MCSLKSDTGLLCNCIWRLFSNITYTIESDYASIYIYLGCFSNLSVNFIYLLSHLVIYLKILGSLQNFGYWLIGMQATLAYESF